MSHIQRTSVALVAGFLLASVAVAGLDSAARDKVRTDLLSRHFVAKTDLYEAKVYKSGQVESEADDEAIKAGFPVKIDSVTFSSSRIRIKMKHPYVHESTYVEFCFEQVLSPDFSLERDIFEKMLSAVFEEKKGDK
jgi:hypothetical protein